MFQILASLGLTYLAVPGTLTTGCVVARGLMRATSAALRGNFGEASVEALAAVTAPAVMAAQAGANLVGEVIQGANDLIGGVLEDGQEEFEAEHESEFPPRSGARIPCRS